MGQPEQHIDSGFGEWLGCSLMLMSKLRLLMKRKTQPRPPSFFNPLSRPSIPMPIPNPVRIRRRLAAPHRTGSKLSPPLGEVVRSRSSRRYAVATLWG